MRGKLGYKPAIIALARKLLMLVHHLLVKREPYFEENLQKKKPVKITSSSLSSMNPDQILKILYDAVTELSESDSAEFVRKLNHIGNS